ncbi:hypothetical protein CFter6_2154 [Collimonas fungivorans]|uniref:Uncharacterized protein n=2 Tax=Collimonas fungivorans TaxID=158899 RepID=G0ABK1_COLFT|nr:hypothetical protein CFU_1735 [Collimonas fungivorans Ter331]AMO94843.1 hypothetical protein CFter6_2154 [Collimonas fungivorans]
MESSFDNVSLQDLIPKFLTPKFSLQDLTPKFSKFRFS